MVHGLCIMYGGRGGGSDRRRIDSLLQLEETKSGLMEE